MTSPGQPHTPLRPTWLCRACAAPWPCLTARSLLVVEYTDNRVGLSVYLGSALYAAIDDLYRLNPNPGPDPAAMFHRFLGWAAPPRARPR